MVRWSFYIIRQTQKYKILIYKNQISYTIIIDKSIVDNKELVDQIAILSPHVIYYSKKLIWAWPKGFNIGITTLISLQGLNNKNSPMEVYIGWHYWIGSNVTIFKTTIIGDNSVTGAGVVVSGTIFPIEL